MKDKNETMKNSKQFEKYLKGLANCHRLDILILVSKSPGITVDGISERIECSFANTSSHTHRLVNAGLLNKKYSGRAVSHTISPYGKKFLDFLETF